MEPTATPQNLLRPASVTLAVQAIWCVNAVSALVVMLDVDDAGGDMDGLVVNVLLLCVYGIVTWMIGVGANWARLTYACLVALEVALIAAFGMDGTSDLDVLATALTTPLEFWALYKLFGSDGTLWFKVRAKSK